MPPRREPVPELTVMDLICQFNKLKPLKFQGRTKGRVETKTAELI